MKYYHNTHGVDYAGIIRSPMNLFIIGNKTTHLDKIHFLLIFQISYGENVWLSYFCFVFHIGKLYLDNEIIQLSNIESNDKL